MRQLASLFFRHSRAWLDAQDMIEQSFDIAGDLSSGFVNLTVEPFDDQNSTRQLIGLTLEFDGRIDMELEIKNFTTLDLGPDEWAYDAGANMILAFDEKPGFEDGGPFFGLGGVYEAGITGTLSAGSGGPPPPFGNPTAGDVTVTADFGNSFSSELQYEQRVVLFRQRSTIESQVRSISRLGRNSTGGRTIWIHRWQRNHARFFWRIDSHLRMGRRLRTPGGLQW